ncbi:hypothetical protein MESS4_550052 [Mesorhizobium sp. STM 4661]|nr:hypothetical protein MESS4_550052 [Mesorhizobium sp. STM 4661]
MKTFYAAEQKRHDPKAFLSSGAKQPNPEKPERVERLLAGAKAAGCTIERPRDHGLGPVAAVPTPEYLFFLEHIFARWQRIEGASAEVIPNIHPIARGGSSTYRWCANPAKRRFSKRLIWRSRAFAPEALVVALGLGAFEGDPFGGLSVTTPGFSRIGEAIARLGLPTVIVQERDYLCEELGDNLTAFLTGFGGKKR